MHASKISIAFILTGLVCISQAKAAPWAGLETGMTPELNLHYNLSMDFSITAGSQVLLTSCRWFRVDMLTIQVDPLESPEVQSPAFAEWVEITDPNSNRLNTYGDTQSIKSIMDPNG